MINLELVDELRKRANVTYDEAKEALEKCNGDILEALIYLEKEKKVNTTKTNCKESSFFASLKALIKKCHAIKFLIKKDENVVINLPLTIVILVTIILPPLTIAALLIALFTNHKIRFIKPDGNDMEINKTFDKMSDAAKNVSSKVTEVINNN